MPGRCGAALDATIRAAEAAKAKSHPALIVAREPCQPRLGPCPKKQSPVMFTEIEHKDLHVCNGRSMGLRSTLLPLASLWPAVWILLSFGVQWGSNAGRVCGHERVAAAQRKTGMTTRLPQCSLTSAI